MATAGGSSKGSRSALHYFFVVVSLAWFAWSIASVFWAFVDSSAPLSSAPLPALLQESTRAPLSSAELEQIAQALRLTRGGASSGTTQAAMPDAANATRLNLRLAGTIPSSQSERGSAILSSEDTQELYRVGEMLRMAPGVRLTAVFDTHVVLDNNGRQESLSMLEPPALTTGDSTSSASPAATDSDALLRSMSETLRAAFSLRPVLADGRLQGLQLFPGTDARLFSSLGFETGDIAVAINGMNVESTQSLPDILRELESSQLASFAVRRGSDTVQVRIDLNSIRP
jgi:general secretion pathway protein C